jgi:hypothetical protein
VDLAYTDNSVGLMSVEFKIDKAVKCTEVRVKSYTKFDFHWSVELLNSDGISSFLFILFYFFI